MVIEKVHGLQATALSLNDRFTLLATRVPELVPVRQRRRPAVGAFFNQNMHLRNRNLTEQIALQLEQQAKRQAFRHRLGVPGGGLRRYGSESSLPGLRRSNSFSNFTNLSNQSIKNRVSWNNSNVNLSRSASFSNLPWGGWQERPLRGFRRRGGGQRALRGRFRGGRLNGGRVTRVTQRGRRLQVPGGRGALASRGAPTSRGAPAPRGARITRGAPIARGAPTARGATSTRGATAARRRGGAVTRAQAKTVPTKEELDAQLDQYMAGTKAALDKELEAYMKSAMEME